MMSTFFHVIWPGSLFTSVFPSTFLIYLFAYVLLFSRSLQWKPWKGNEWRWSAFGLFLAVTTVLNGPVLYEYTNGAPRGLSYLPLFLEVTLLFFGLYAVTASSRLTIFVTMAIGYAAEHIAAGIVQIMGAFIFRTGYGLSQYGYAYKFLAFGVYALAGVLLWIVAGRNAYISDEAIRDRLGWIIGSSVVLVFVIFADALTIGILSLLSGSRIQDGVFFSLILFSYELVCTVMVLAVLLVVSSRDKLVREVEVMKDITYRQQRHYEISQEYRDIINMKMHDLKKIDARVWADSPTAKKVLREALQTYDALYDTGHRAIDAIINEKSLLCAQQGIQIHCMIDGATLHFMDDADVYSLVGNIMDNAIEAVERIDDPQTSTDITLSIQSEGQMVVLREMNAYSGALQMKGGLPHTTKNDRHYEHGFGLRSIQYVVHQYQGHMSICTEGQRFSMTILLPKPLTD